MDDFEAKTKRLEEQIRVFKLRESVPRAGVKKTAISDFERRVAEDFQVDSSGLVTCKRLDSQGEPMTVEGWLAHTRQTAGHLFEPASGGGADSRGGGSGGGTIRISASEAMSPARYRAAKMEAEKRGVPLEIVY